LDTGQADRSQLNVAVRDELGLGRTDEPVQLPLRALDGHDIDGHVLRDDTGQVVPFQVTTTAGDGTQTPAGAIVFLASLPRGSRERLYRLELSDEASATKGAGIAVLDPVQSDGVCRLDTGTYIVELCKGRADGTTAGKWGMRYFAESPSGESLIKDYCNAIGGVYGPFFTPENGLINPPEHAVADVTVLEEGPIVCRYKLSADVPDGLDPVLHGSRIEVVWSFYHRSRWIERTYRLSEYETVIDGMQVANKMTVGDEFEGGKGRLLFPRFAAQPETVYRGGDPYSNVLTSTLEGLLEEVPRDDDPAHREFHDAFARGIRSASYDWYWRPLCVLESFVDPEAVRQRLRAIQDAAGEAMRAAIVVGGLKRSPVVDVGDEPEQTAFVRTATKTAMLDPDTGYSVVWCTSQPVRRYQIVQREQSGWVNWGTNGENEFPELPSGSTIRMAYGQFEEWEDEAARMESPVSARRVR
jgi:hypothetical protein